MQCKEKLEIVVVYEKFKSHLIDTIWSKSSKLKKKKGREEIERKEVKSKNSKWYLYKTIPVSRKRGTLWRAENDLFQPGTCLFLPRHGLRAAFHAGRPRIKCNNASSSGLARTNPSFVNEGGGSRLRPRNAWWLLCQECAHTREQLCSRNNRS